MKETIKVGKRRQRRNQKSMPRISELEQEFYDWCLYDRGLSPETVNDYRRNISLFKRDMGDLGAEKISLEDFSKWKRICKERGVGNRAVSAYLCGLRSFLRFCSEKNLKVIDRLKVKSLKTGSKEIVFLTPKEIEKFVSVVDIRTIEGLRNRVLIETLLGTGMRISETLQRNKNEFDGGKKKIKIVGKGNKERIVYFSDRALKWINDYLNVRTDLHPALFVSHCKAKRLSLATVHNWFQRYSQMANLGKRITPHILRHTFCTTLVKNGCNIAYVQKMAGHIDPQITIKYYVGANEEDLEEAQKKFLNY